MRKASSGVKAEAHRDQLDGANSVTKDYLLFSQPFIHEGALLSSSQTGRRLYIHHLSEVPISEVFTTRVGNHLQRIDKGRVKMGGIELEVQLRPESADVPTSKMLFQIPAAAFTGSVQGRDKMVLQLLQKGKDANAGGDFALACACFEAAYALSVRAGMLVSAANMRLKLGEVATASAMYRLVLSDSGLLPAEREMANRKLTEAQGMDTQQRPRDDGGFRASFGESVDSANGDDGDSGWGASFDDASPASATHAKPVPAAARSMPEGGFDADFDEGGFDDGFDDGFDEGFADFDEPPAAVRTSAPREPARTVAPSAPMDPPGSGDGFADFGGFDDGPPASMQIKPAPLVRVEAVAAPPGFTAFDEPDGGADFAAFGEPRDDGAHSAAPPLAAQSSVPSGNGSRAACSMQVSAAPGVDSGALARMEARMARLEETVRGGPSELAVFEHGQKIDALSAQVERRMAGVKKGMEALHGRLQAVELAMAKLPEHLKSFRTKNKETAKLGKEHTLQISQLQAAIPALSEAAKECRDRVVELQQLSASLAAGSADVLSIPAQSDAALASTAEVGGPLVAEYSEAALTGYDAAAQSQPSDWVDSPVVMAAGSGTLGDFESVSGTSLGGGGGGHVTTEAAALFGEFAEPFGEQDMASAVVDQPPCDSAPLSAPGSTEQSFDAPAEPPFSETAEQSFDAPAEPPFSATAEQSFDAPVEPPLSATAEQSFDAPAEPPFGATAEQSFDAPAEPPFSATAEQSFDAPAEPPFGASDEQSFDAPAEPPFGATAEQSFDAPAEPPFSASAEQSFDAPVQETFDAPVEQSFDAPAEESFSASFEQLVEPPSESFDAPAEQSFDAPAELFDAPAAELTSAPTLACDASSAGAGVEVASLVATSPSAADAAFSSFNGFSDTTPQGVSPAAPSSVGDLSSTVSFGTFEDAPFPACTPSSSAVSEPMPAPVPPSLGAAFDTADLDTKASSAPAFGAFASESPAFDAFADFSGAAPVAATSSAEGSGAPSHVAAILGDLPIGPGEAQGFSAFSDGLATHLGGGEAPLTLPTTSTPMFELGATLHSGSMVGDVAAGVAGSVSPGAAFGVELGAERRQEDSSSSDLGAREHASSSDFLESLMHDIDPKLVERERSKSIDGGASEATVEDIEFANFDAKNLEARSQTFQDIGASVTDDEFNALFGPTE